MARTDTETLQATILEWSEQTRRDLPWRRTRDPWAVLVSELMLQQTQVARVVPRYHAFLDQFPDAAACAAAPVGAVVEAWAGLGYNRRAVYLHRAAVAVVERHGGQLPDRLDQLIALPGIGQYTARAVLAFAFERRHGVVETNVGPGPGPGRGRRAAHAAGGAVLGRRAGSRGHGLVLEPGHGRSRRHRLHDPGAALR